MCSTVPAALCAHEVVVAGENSETIWGENIYINTGSVPVMSPVEGIEGNPLVYTSETLLNLRLLPRRLIIIGGGYIGLEFASMYAAFGA